MRNVKKWVCLIMATLLLCMAVPAWAQEGTEDTISIPAYTTSQRARLAGKYISVTLNENTLNRMATRLGQIVAAKQDRFDDEDTAAAVIQGWFDSTHNNVDSFYTLTLGDSGDILISPENLPTFDLVYLTDAQGRGMLYPFQQYSYDLYGDVCDEAVAILYDLLAPLLDIAFQNTLQTREEEDIRNKLEVAYDELKSSFHMTVEDARKVFAPDLMLTEDTTLESALVVDAELFIGSAGSSMKGVRVAAENGSEAWYKLSLSDGVFSGGKLASPVSFSELRNTTTASPTLWLNEACQVIYLTAGDPAFSADAVRLNQLLSQRGGQASDQIASDDNRAEGGSSFSVWYIVILLAVLAVAAWLLIRGRKKGGRVRAHRAGGSSAPAENHAETKAEQ